MRFCKTHSQRLISQMVLAGLLFPWAPALAGDDFANWQPKPLVDNNVPAAPAQPKPQAIANQPVQPVQPDLEARLKPAEPFVKQIENRLTITPKPGMGMVQRLNNLQTVLFGTLQYQDAGQLITKLAEVFPDEAKKAQAEMDKQAQLAQANAAQATAQANKGKIPAPITQPAAPNQMASASGQMQNATKKKRRSFWNTDDFDSDFDNDPFFQNSGLQGQVKTSALQSSGAASQAMSAMQQQAAQQPYNGQAYTQQSQGPSKLSAIAQGLAGLALVAGGIAGAAFLNNKMGGNNMGYGYPNGYNGYNTPYGYPAYGTGYGYNNPYGYGKNSYGTGMGSYGYGMGTSSFGNGFGTSTFGGTGAGMFMSPGSSTGLGLSPVFSY